MNSTRQSSTYPDLVDLTMAENINLKVENEILRNLLASSGVIVKGEGRNVSIDQDCRGELPRVTAQDVENYVRAKEEVFLRMSSMTECDMLMEPLEGVHGLPKFECYELLRTSYKTGFYSGLRMFEQFRICAAFEARRAG